MGYSTSFLTSFLFLIVVLNVASGNPLVPALFVFGNSVFDVGNNNYLSTIVKSNFPPYGKDFENHIPTGRFCNGKLTIDYAAENLGFTSSPPAYRRLYTKGKNLLTGVNFASAATGYYDHTATIYHTDSLSKQLIHYQDCKDELVKTVGQSSALSIITGALYLVSNGVDDFILNYYMNPLLNKVYTVDQFSDFLATCYSIFIQKLYALGARRIGVITLPPFGFLPVANTLYCLGAMECAVKLNNDAVNFNKKLNLTSQILQKMFSDLVLVPLDVYQPIYEFVTKPYEYGFFEGRKACCGTGLIETSVLCNSLSIGTCANASEYVFWDGLHPSQAACKILADKLLWQAISFSSLLNHTILD